MKNFNNTIKILDENGYPIDVPVAKDKTWLDKYIDIKEMSNGEYYELWLTYNGKLVAVINED